MRLLKSDSEGKFHFTANLIGNTPIPPYAILSHTWGPDGDELTYKDIANFDSSVKKKPGYAKLQFCAQQARRDALDCFWVDSCCIDKTDSGELTEAINSMFKWYSNAARCYVYLSDVSLVSLQDHVDEARHERSETECIRLKCPWVLDFQASRWFTRGWTLQELVAPTTVAFFSSEGASLGDKRFLEQLIQERSRIPVSALRGKPLSEFTVKERLKWAETRETTREEDLAYCLLGIFGVFIPVIYGEGKENARHRLNKAIEEKNSQVGLLPTIRPYVAGAINGLIGGIGGAIATLAMRPSAPLDEEEPTRSEQTGFTATPSTTNTRNTRTRRTPPSYESTYHHAASSAPARGRMASYKQPPYTPNRPTTYTSESYHAASSEPNRDRLTSPTSSNSTSYIPTPCTPNKPTPSATPNKPTPSATPTTPSATPNKPAPDSPDIPTSCEPTNNRSGQYNRSGQWVEISSYALCKQDITEIIGNIFSLPTSSIMIVQVNAP